MSKPFDLAALCAAYPLPPAWSKPESFSEVITIYGQSHEVLGLMSKNKDGQMALGSCFSSRENFELIAYFEMLERVVAITEGSRASTLYLAKSILAPEKKYLELSSTQLWPTPTEESRYAVSNGVAAHTEFSRAAKSAKFELYERDAILRSWHGGAKPEAIRGTPLDWPAQLKDLYKIQFYRFSSAPETSVVGCFALPLDVRNPFIFGFGCSDQQASASAKAADEATQRLVFLWGEDIPDGPPPFKASPDFHQDYYLYPGHHAIIKDWLEGRFRKGNSAIDRSLMDEDIYLIDLTPERWRQKLHIVRAFAKEAIPLVFGNPAGIDAKLASPFFHPIC